MSQSRCLQCKKAAGGQMVSLVCDHIICSQCADTLKSVEGHSNIENKYRLSCPSCNKVTVTYDVKNLLIKETPDNLMFENLQSSEINESSLAEEYQRPNSQFKNYKEMSYSQRVNNLSRKESRTPDVCFESKENRSKLSHDSNRASRQGHREEEYASICKEHSQNLVFFCENEKKTLCVQCMYKHTKEHKSHKVLSIKNSVSIISKENQAFKGEIKRRMEELEEYVKITHNNKTLLEEKFKSTLDMVAEEFSSIQSMLQDREAMLRDTLKNIFLQKDRDLNTEIADLTHLQNCLKQYMVFQLDGQSSEVYFFHAYSLLKEAMSKLDLKVHLLSPSSIILLDKLDHTQIKDTIERLFQLPRERRPESRADSAHPKHSSLLNQEIKNAKKKLQKLQRLQKSDKAHHYLNNYIMDGSKDKYFHKQRRSVAIENQRKLHNKVITPTRVSSKMKQRK